MMLKKLAAAVTAASMAIIPFPAGNVNVFTPMNVYAEGTGAKAALPDWIPEDFESALEFRNTYGAVHIQDDLICIVYPNRAPKWKSSDTYGYELRTTADMGQKLKQEIYLSDQTETCFEVFVYQPQVHGDLELKLVDPHVQVNDTPDNWEPPTVAEYTFNVDERLDITETDIYGWLPDCAEEYRMYDITHFNVSVKDNYVVFLLPHNAGTAYDWTLNEKGEDCFELAAVSDCSTISAVPLDGGEINTIYAYKAVKDGCDRISYDFGAVYAGGKKEETRTANCAVFNDAQTVLLSGDMRVTLLDYDTDELIILGEDEVPMIWTNVEINTSEGVMATGPILEINANPSVVDHSISGFFNADVFSFGLQDAPDGYELPGKEGERSGYYNGKIIPEDQMTVTRFDNGSADVVFRLKNKKISPMEMPISLNTQLKMRTYMIS